MHRLQHLQSQVKLWMYKAGTTRCNSSCHSPSFGTYYSGVSNIDGYYAIMGMKPGIYQLETRYIGYEKSVW